MITIDSTKGGNGDVWMRLVSFYAFAKLLPGLKFRICVPAFLRDLAEFTFGDRLTIVSDFQGKVDLTYTHLGIKDLLKPILGGQRFISPYQRSVIKDKKKKELKDRINTIIFDIADFFGFVQLPDSKYITFYQGYLDVIGIKKLRSVNYERYLEQLLADYPLLVQKQMGNLPVSEELTIPDNLPQSILVYPTGTSRQFVPMWWAVKYMPDAYYAFFFKDPDLLEFANAGLKVIAFYKEPGDIIRLSQVARWTMSTDSFPSHLLQYATANCTLVLTEVLKSRIVSPVFKGKVVNSLAPCHPCLHMARNLHPLCAAGFKECLNWRNPVYTHDIVNSVNTLQHNG
ncbi:MAG: hypothetical protein WKF66_19300 [Pedobacter sp.]